MLKYFDPIELMLIDIENTKVSFYLILVSKNPNKYKVCATTQNLESPDMAKCDPETRITHYWSLNLDEIRGGKIDILFPSPEKTLSSKLFTLDELNSTLNFAKPFNPEEQPQKKFGPQTSSLNQYSVFSRQFQPFRYGCPGITSVSPSNYGHLPLPIVDEKTTAARQDIR